MSMPNGNVRCHGCDFEGVIQRRPITLEYVLPNGAVVQGYRVSAFCSSCDNVTDAEMLFDVASIQAEIDSLKKRRGGFISRFFGGGKEEEVEIQRLQGELQFADLRRSGPRCLRCGETTVTRLSFDESGESSVVHTCGHRLFMEPEDPNAPRFMYRPEIIRLDPEGRKI